MSKSLMSLFWRSNNGEKTESPHQNGYYLAKTPLLNKGQSFTQSEREEFGLRGLYPSGTPLTLDIKVEISLAQLRNKVSPLEKYIYLHTIQDSDETLFYAILMRNTYEIMPFVYTPTVGEACQKWNIIFRHTPRGLYLSIHDMGHIRSILDNYPNKNIKVIVVTDGERILGLGDLGVNGMGIPIGKLALYTACAGIDPSQCLPVHIDVGTENKGYIADPYYMGLKQPRVRGAEYEAVIHEFFDACIDAYGRTVLIQFEDFGNTTAFKLLDIFQSKALCFNDDIQGTASVVLAGVLASLPLAGKTKVSEHTFLFFGAGEAGTGIASLIAASIKKEKGEDATIEEARKNIWLFDSKGIVTNSRKEALLHKKPFAHDPPMDGDINDLLTAIQILKPTVLVGVSAQTGAFHEGICQEMMKHNEVPLILSLSNPTSKAECTAEEAYKWTDGKCIFFSGSPFDNVTMPDGTIRIPGQGNNAYIFPGVGLGAIAAGALTLTDDDFTVAAQCLASQVSAERLAQGCAYPSLNDIRHVSLEIAVAVATNIITQNRASSDHKRDDSIPMIEQCRRLMYEPSYTLHSKL